MNPYYIAMIHTHLMIHCTLYFRIRIYFDWVVIYNLHGVGIKVI